MSDFLDLCRRPVEHGKPAAGLEAARPTPSACNSQPWSFVVAENPEIGPEVAKCAQQLGMNEFASKARAFFVVLGDTPS